DAVRGDLVGERVDLRELAHLELAALHAHQPAAQLGRPAEAHDDRGRRREHLGFEAESIAHRTQSLLETMRGSAVAVKGTPEGEDESDRGLWVHASIVPEKHERPGGNPGVRYRQDQLTKKLGILGS